MELLPPFLPLLGTWTGTERQEASPWAAATTSRASLVLKLDVAATVVVQDYRRVRADGSELSGHGVFRADPEGDAVLWWFFDSDGQVPVPARGEWQGPALQLERVTPGGRERHHFCAAGDRLDYRVDVARQGDPGWLAHLTGTYARISGH